MGTEPVSTSMTHIITREHGHDPGLGRWLSRACITDSAPQQYSTHKSDPCVLPMQHSGIGSGSWGVRAIPEYMSIRELTLLLICRGVAWAQT